MKFRYKDRLRIIGGFYEGAVGVATKVLFVEGESPSYRLKVDDTDLWMEEELLELDAPTPSAVPIEGDDMPSDEAMLMYSTDSFDEMEQTLKDAQAPEQTP